MNTILTTTPAKAFVLSFFAFTLWIELAVSQPYEKKAIVNNCEESFECNSSMLSDVTKVLFKWYHVKIAFDNKEITSMTFTGSLKKKQGIRSIMSIIEMCLGLQGYYKGDVLHLKVVS